MFILNNDKYVIVVYTLSPLALILCSPVRSIICHNVEFRRAYIVYVRIKNVKYKTYRVAICHCACVCVFVKKDAQTISVQIIR